MNKKIISLLAASALMGGSFVTMTSHNRTVVQAKKKAVSVKKSQENLAKAVTTPMTKDNYENLENGLIQSAQQNAQDTSDGLSDKGDNSAATQQHIKKFQRRTGNLTKISERNKKEVKSWKSSLTTSDYKKLKKYNKALDNYIETLQDYASNIDSEGAVQNDPNASAKDKTDAQNDISKSQVKFNQAKNKWEQMYDQLSVNTQ
ncbi:MAG: hypothetical protein ACI4TY_01005 [Candidatus Limosilactobacillus intestinavium]